MFRKPRESTTVSISEIPSVGRPPTPERQFATRNPVTQSPMSNSTLKPLQGTKTPNAKQKTPNGKSKAKGNASILSFFKKADTTPEKEAEQDEDELFVRDDLVPETKSVPERPSLVSRLTSSDEARFNENVGAVKKRRTSLDTSLKDEGATEQSVKEEITVPPLRELPFAGSQQYSGGISGQEVNLKVEADSPAHSTSTRKGSPFKLPPLPLKRKDTTVSEDLFDGIEDFEEDEFPEEGEEFAERLYMQEQRALERAFEDDIDGEDTGDSEMYSTRKFTETPQDTDAMCPICNDSLAGLSTAEASVHVNRCLDGDPLPVKRPATDTVSIKPDPDSKPVQRRFQAAAIPRPPQENPLNFARPSGGTAFSKIMSSHAEDQAWSTAAANEVAARGKPAFKRTCPFYKILPGFFTCVDAFRYGAVEGCNAYFLSHFHSDHYIGLTSSWCHGPIYCSRVTGNLVRQQLRVDPRWVVDLEFDKTQEVPCTDGVQVTMIPANHCPGSSLYLFEKVVGKGSKPKKQRILHCGDFRACPAHVQHPLLRPDVLDAATGKNREQKLDVVYLDTTYLTPKYAFPNQENVITACADMCVSLSKENIDENDSWERTKKERAGTGMAKFVQQKDKPPESTTLTQSSLLPTQRGRLLVVIGTYSIGKERICLGIAKALNSKIFAPPGKMKICRALEDPELDALLTGDPLEAQVHMQILMEIRAETLADYLTSYKPHFSRVVGFRPTGWNYRPPSHRFIESPSVQTVLYGDNWKTAYSMKDLVPQRGSTRLANCFGVPYSEHSSFRELSMFCCALRIEKIIPTVNVGNAKSREKMKVWIDRWAMDRKKNGLYQVENEATEWT